MKYPLASSLMFERELRLCRYCSVCHLVFGFAAGLASVLLWNWKPLYVLPAIAALLLVSVYVWEKLARWLVRLLLG
jgi:hypothetical protein